MENILLHHVPKLDYYNYILLLVVFILIASYIVQLVL